jgi:hypothetical protein
MHSGSKFKHIATTRLTAVNFNGLFLIYLTYSSQVGAISRRFDARPIAHLPNSGDYYLSNVSLQGLGDYKSESQSFFSSCPKTNWPITVQTISEA